LRSAAPGWDGCPASAGSPAAGWDPDDWVAPTVDARFVPVVRSDSARAGWAQADSAGSALDDCSVAPTADDHSVPVARSDSARAGWAQGDSVDSALDDCSVVPTADDHSVLATRSDGSAPAGRSVDWVAADSVAAGHSAALKPDDHSVLATRSDDSAPAGCSVDSVAAGHWAGFHPDVHSLQDYPVDWQAEGFHLDARQNCPAGFRDGSCRESPWRACRAAPVSREEAERQPTRPDASSASPGGRRIVQDAASAPAALRRRKAEAEAAQLLRLPADVRRLAEEPLRGSQYWHERRALPHAPEAPRPSKRPAPWQIAVDSPPPPTFARAARWRKHVAASPSPHHEHCDLRR
jgi:hypothetical protein